jgi:hypothetical protein
MRAIPAGDKWEALTGLKRDGSRHRITNLDALGRRPGDRVMGWTIRWWEGSNLPWAQESKAALDGQTSRVQSDAPGTGVRSHAYDALLSPEKPAKPTPFSTRSHGRTIKFSQLAAYTLVMVRRKVR